MADECVGVPIDKLKAIVFRAQLAIDFRDNIPAWQETLERDQQFIHELDTIIEQNSSIGGSAGDSARVLGRLGGLANKGKTSVDKAKAARDNGKKGGRPTARCPRCGLPSHMCGSRWNALCVCQHDGCLEKPTRLIDKDVFCNKHEARS